MVDQFLEEVLKQFEQFNSIKNYEFKDSCYPGYFIKFRDDIQDYYGIILGSKQIMYWSKTGVIMGYIENYSETIPFKVIAIYRPTSTYYKITDIENMSVIWKYEEDHKFRISKREIAEKLGIKEDEIIFY